MPEVISTRLLRGPIGYYWGDPIMHGVPEVDPGPFPDDQFAWQWAIPYQAYVTSSERVEHTEPEHALTNAELSITLGALQRASSGQTVVCFGVRNSNENETSDNGWDATQYFLFEKSVDDPTMPEADPLHDIFGAVLSPSEAGVLAEAIRIRERKNVAIQLWSLIQSIDLNR